MSGWQPGESDPESHPLGRHPPSHPYRRSIEPRMGSNWSVGWIIIIHDDERRASYSYVYSTTTASSSRRRRRKKANARIWILKKQYQKAPKARHEARFGFGLGLRPREAGYRLPSEFDEVFHAGVVWRGAVITVRGVRGGVPPSPDRPRPWVTWPGTPPTRTCSIGRRARRRRVRRARTAAGMRRACAERAPPLPAPPRLPVPVPVTVIAHTTKAPTAWFFRRTSTELEKIHHDRISNHIHR